jgi:hypothetical protein
MHASVASSEGGLSLATELTHVDWLKPYPARVTLLARVRTDSLHLDVSSKTVPSGLCDTTPPLDRPVVELSQQLLDRLNCTYNGYGVSSSPWTRFLAMVSTMGVRSVDRGSAHPVRRKWLFSMSAWQPVRDARGH